MAEEQEKKELVAKDFTDGMVLKIKDKEKFGLAFPKDYNYSNELMAAMLILQETTDRNKQPVLQSCSRASIEATLMDMVTSGLSMQKKQCYPIAYNGQLQLQKSVFGNTCIARRYGLKDIDAEVVYKGDEFVYHIENAQKIIDKHTQDMANIDNDNIIGAYAVATMRDGTQHVEVMTMPMIKKAWAQGYNYRENGNGTHQKFTDQMCMKTVKNRLLKFINNTYGSIEETYDDNLPPVTEDENIVDAEISENENSVDFVVDDADIEIIEPEKIDNSDAPFM